MIVKNIEEIDGKTVITTKETITPARKVKRLFRKPILIEAVVETRRFKAISRLVGKYYKWVELPENNLVPGLLSYQLDTWKEIEDKEKP